MGLPKIRTKQSKPIHIHRKERLVIFLDNLGTCTKQVTISVCQSGKSK